MLWFIPVVLYNLWMMARFLTDKQTGTIGGRSPLPLTRFVSLMQAARLAAPTHNIRCAP